HIICFSSRVECEAFRPAGGLYINIRRQLHAAILYQSNQRSCGISRIGCIMHFEYNLLPATDEPIRVLNNLITTEVLVRRIPCWVYSDHSSSDCVITPKISGSKSR